MAVGRREMDDTADRLTDAWHNSASGHLIDACRAYDLDYDRVRDWMARGFDESYEWGALKWLLDELESRETRARDFGRSALTIGFLSGLLVGIELARSDARRRP